MFWSATIIRELVLGLS